MKQFQAYLIFLRLFRESYLFALQEIVVNKVRTILSLLGITIGIFCVISVFTVFDSMESAIRKEKMLKNWKRAWKLELIERSNPNWQDLYETIV